jgi:hypothetical protein
MLSEEDGEAKVDDKADPEMVATRGLAVRHVMGVLLGALLRRV